MGFLHKDLLRLISCFEYRWFFNKITNEIQTNVELTVTKHEFTKSKSSIHGNVFHRIRNKWKYEDVDEITKNEYMIIEDYFEEWMDFTHILSFSFINGEVFTLEKNEEKYKLTKSQYKNRREVYEAFRNFYK